MMLSGFVKCWDLLLRCLLDLLVIVLDISSYHIFFSKIAGNIV